MGSKKERFALHEILLSSSGGCDCKTSRQCYDARCSEVIEVRLPHGRINIDMSYDLLVKEVIRGNMPGIFFCHKTGMTFPVRVLEDE